MATAEMYPKDDRVNVDEIIQKLVELFGNVFDFHVIHSVARECNYNIDEASNELLELTSNSKNNGVINRHSGPRFGNSGCASPKSKGRLSYSAVGSNQNTDDADVIIESEITNYNTPTQNSPFHNVSVRSKTQSKKEMEFERIVQHIRQGVKILILIRGLPGSGKSYLAKQIVDRTVGFKDYSIFICSTDDYFFNERTGKYNYDPYKLQEAHEFNKQRAYKKISTGVSPVIIDNTNTQMWEMKSYAMIGANFGYIIEILEPFTSWAWDEKLLSVKNTHGVPKAKIREMALRYEKHITPRSLFDTYKLSYLNEIPPVLRDFPPVQHALPKAKPPRKKRIDDMHVQLASNFTDLIGFDDKPNVKAVPFISNDGRVDAKGSHSNLMDSVLPDSNVNHDTILQPSISSLEKSRNINLHSEPETKKMSLSTNKFQSKLGSDDNNETSSDKVVEQIKTAKSIYPSLNLSSWGFPDNVSSWEFWDVVTPLSDSRNVSNSLKMELNGEIQEIAEKSHSATNTSSYDFALLTKKEFIPNEEVKVLNAVNRDINLGIGSTPPNSPPKKMLLHKSSMTNEDDTYIIGNEVEHLENLRTLFPEIPFDYIHDIYDKCGKNIDWAVDLLLDDNREILPSINPKIINTSPIKVGSARNASESSLKFSDTLPNDDLSGIEKHIIESVEINKDFYSDHIWKIKNSRQRCTNNQIKQTELQSSSGVSTFDVTSTRLGEVIAVSSHIDMNDFEPDIDFPLFEENDVEQTVEINLGDGCILQLEQLFGFPETFPKGFQPVVQVPIELAEQLHAFYIQSVLVQMETQNMVLDLIVKEDEELAKKLQFQDDVIMDDDSGRKTPNLNEIIKEEVANKAYRREMEEWKKLTPDTLAAKLTMQKLETSFPSVSKSVLMEILHAHNNSYEQTVEVLLASTDRTSVYDPYEDIREPPIPDSVLKEMKRASEEKLATENIQDLAKTANEYRDEANDYYQRHNEYMQQAQQAFQKKQYAVAQFYSTLAKSYTRLYEQTNGLAATAFLEEHSEKLQNFQTLDLHYLYVKEALSALDIFLDRNINLLKGTNKKKEKLFIITGRGKRSPGKSRLRPAIIQHLQKRNIKYSLLNPGLLDVTIHPHSVLTSNLQQ